MKETKRSVATYSLDSGIASMFWVREILKIIVALTRHGLIVNNIVGDGASENRSAMKSLGTLSIEDVHEFHLNDNFRRLRLFPWHLSRVFLYYPVYYRKTLSGLRLILPLKVEDARLHLTPIWIPPFSNHDLFMVQDKIFKTFIIVKWRIILLFIC